MVNISLLHQCMLYVLKNKKIREDKTALQRKKKKILLDKQHVTAGESRHKISLSGSGIVLYSLSKLYHH